MTVDTYRLDLLIRGRGRLGRSRGNASPSPETKKQCVLGVFFLREVPSNEERRLIQQLNNTHVAVDFRSTFYSSIFRCPTRERCWVSSSLDREGSVQSLASVAPLRLCAVGYATKLWKDSRAVFIFRLVNACFNTGSLSLIVQQIPSRTATSGYARQVTHTAVCTRTRFFSR